MMQGGHSMKQDVVMREIGWTIKRVLPLVPKDRNIKKSDFQAILDEILMCLHRNRKISIDAIAEKTEKVLSDMPNEYGQLPEDARSWEALIGYLYAKYLKELEQL
jgi:hypothetical protein